MVNKITTFGLVFIAGIGFGYFWHYKALAKTIVQVSGISG